jgi:hypothetical protein
MAYIGTDINYGNIASQTGTGDGSDTTPIDPLSYSVPTSASIIVTLDGVTQVPTTDYVASGTTLTFTTAPVNLVKILVVFLGRSLDLGTPADNTVTNAKMANNAIDSAELVAGSVDDAHLATGITASKLSGVVPTANLGTGTASSTTVLYGDGTYKAEPVTDLTAVRQDIAMLALYNAVSDNRAAYNLPFSFIDQFEDDTGLTTQTDVDRHSDEYVASVYTATTTYNPSASSHWLGTSTGNATYGSGIVACTSGDKAIYSDNTFTGDFSISATIADVSPGAWVGVWPTSEIATWSAGEETGNMRYYTHSYFYCGISRAAQTAGFNKGDHPSNTNLAAYSSSDGDVVKITRVGSTIYNYLNGVLKHTQTSIPTTDMKLTIGMGGASAPVYSSYTGIGWDATSSVANATGTLISDTQTSSVATTKMSGVILYKDNGSGASTLGTHLKIYLSADNGSNWTEVPSYGAVTPLFSTGVKMVRLGETTVTSGTAPVMKAVWASQASGTLETQLHGWAMNY